MAEIQEITDQGSAGRTPGRIGDSMLSGVTNEVPDDQEIRGEAHPVDHAQLMLHPIDGGLRRVLAIAIAKPLLAEFAEVILGRLLVGRLERGKLALAQVEALVVLLDHLGDPDRGGERLRVVRQRRVHLLGAPDVELVVLEPHPVRVVEGPAGVDAEQDIVDFGVFLHQIMGVAGADQGQAHPAGKVGRRLFVVLLDLDAVALDLDVEILLAEDLLIPGAELLGVLALAVEDVVGELGRDAAREADQPFRMAFEDLLVDPGLVIEPFEERHRGEPHQIADPLTVPGQQGEVEVVLVAREPPAGALGPSTGRDVSLHANDRLDLGRFRLPEKLHGSVEVAVVGHGNGRHPQRLGPLDQGRDLARPVQKAVMAVAMQVDERPARHQSPRSGRVLDALGQSGRAGDSEQAFHVSLPGNVRLSKTGPHPDSQIG